MTMKLSSVVLSVLFLIVAVAQTRDALIGTWQAQYSGDTIIQTINVDGSYRFDIAAQNYHETGTWQLDEENYSQQWQDPTTSEAKEATYQLEFLDENTFVQSGGNLNGVAFTFTRVNTTATNPSSAPTTTPTVALLNKSYLLKFPPPEPGEYTCSSSHLSVGTTFDPTGAFGDTIPVYGVQVLESLVGNLVLNADGTYKMTKSTGRGGTYLFDAVTNQVKFTGELAVFPIDYFVTDGWFTLRLNFLDETSREVASLECAHPSPNAGAPTTATPNPGLPGTLVLHATTNQLVRVVAESAEVQLVAQGREPFQAANGETIYLSNASEFVILDANGVTTAQLPIDDGSEASDTTDVADILFSSYTAEASEPVLSPDGSLIAYNSVTSLGDQRVIVRRRVGQGSKVVAVFEGMARPTWTKDGGLIMSGGASAFSSLSSVEGIYITDASLSEPKRIDPNLDNPSVPILSPDGKTVVLLYNGQLWLMGVDGSNLRALTAEVGLEFYGYPTWSPDGEWLAVAAAEPSFESWSFVLVLPANGDMTKAQRLDLPDLSPINVSRDSRIAWY